MYRGRRIALYGKIYSTILLYFRRYLRRIFPRQPDFCHQTWMSDGIWCMHPFLQIQRGKYSVRRVLWRRRLLCSAIFGAPGQPVRARCLSTPSSLHPRTPILATIYLYGLPTLITGIISCATACLGLVLVPIAQLHQHVKACGSIAGAHVCMCPCVQACQCSFCVVCYWW